jgi:multimeric flavodoxin WrbA
MPLCHWPCSCYPNHALDQTGDVMADVYERFVLAHGVVIVTPVHWYQAPSVLKLLMDRMVCADGGNPDPTRTGGKDPARAKAIELEGWDYPQHLAGRAFGVITHGDAAGARELRRALSDWLADMGLVPAGEFAELDRFIGYYEPYATSHAALDRDPALIEEARNVARAVCTAVGDLRAGRREESGRSLTRPRPK